MEDAGVIIFAIVLLSVTLWIGLSKEQSDQSGIKKKRSKPLEGMDEDREDDEELDRQFQMAELIKLKPPFPK